MTMRLKKTTRLAGSAFILYAGCVCAQDQPAGTQAAQLEEVVVTAQKRVENLQNVPVSITALGGNELERIDSPSLVDFARRVPGLSFRSTGPGENEVVVRGIASASSTLRQTTGYYLDDTPISALGLGAIDAGLFDLARIEVLRGPQGTLYGSGSMGGTVRLITNKPDFDRFSARGDVALAETHGGNMSESINAGINLPINQKLALRGVGYLRNDGGWIDRARRVMRFNAHDPSQYRADLSLPVEKNVNGQETRGMRLALTFNPTESLSIVPSVFYQHLYMDSRADYDQPPGSGDNQLQTRIVPESIEDTFTLSNLTARFSTHALEFLSSTSYFDRKRLDVEDVSTVPLFFFQPLQTSLIASPYTSDNRNHAFVEEVRMSTLSDGPFRVIAGLFYSDSTSNLGTLSRGPGFSQAVFPIVDDIFSESQSRLNTSERAAFGELSYRILDSLTMTVGVRHFKSKTTSVGTRGGFAVNPPRGGLTIVVPEIDQEESGTNPKYLLSWQATPDALLYGTAAQGFRPGGVNGPFPNAFCGGDLAALGLTKPPEQFNADTLWNYEFGAKTRWLDRRLTVNSAVYYIDWTAVQQQVALPCGFEFLGNFGSARSRGAELEVTAQVSDHLVLATGAGFNKAELTGRGIAGVAGGPGDPLQNAPRWTVNGSADYSRPLTAVLTGGLTLNYQYTSEVFGSFEPTNPDYRRPGYATVQLNARIATDRYEYSLFVNNLTNVNAQTAFAGSAALDTPGVRVVVPIRPRTIGLKVAVRF
jgi:outer membrane receptor protein involved in Fe transport